MNEFENHQEENRQEPQIDDQGGVQSARPGVETGQALGSGNIEKIRDILFGAQSRDYEKRFTRLEERISKEISDLREEIRRRIDAVESFSKSEIQALEERLQSEQNRRSDGDKDLSRQLEDTAKNLERNTQQLDDQTNRSIRDIRQQILDLSKNLSDDMVQRHQEVSSLVDKYVSELRHDKVDRSAMADLLTEVAMRLSEDFPSQLGFDGDEINNG